MKKIVLPALAALMIVAAPAAFAGTSSGSWFVLADSNIHSCFAANRTAATGEETLGGPYASQAAAISAIGANVQCGGQYGSDS
jgi:hypothetical protein